MNPGRYFTPGMRSLGNVARMGNMGMRMSPIITSRYFPTRGVGLFGRIGNSLRSFNWSTLLNGTSKTLNVVNQAIPLVRQAKPMFSNIRSMIHLTKAFKNETFFGINNDTKNNQNKTIDRKNTISNVNNNNLFDNNNMLSNNNYPNFFI